MRLTAEHRRALEAVRAGAGREQLGFLATTPAFIDLIIWNLVRCRLEPPDEHGQQAEVWSLTETGVATLDSQDE